MSGKNLVLNGKKNKKMGYISYFKVIIVVV